MTFFDFDRLVEPINTFWSGFGMWVLAAAAAVAVVALILSARLVARLARRLWSDNPKLVIGFAAVQAGVTVTVITGVYEFFHRRLGMDPVESTILAVFLEATVWAAVGYVVEHGRKPGSVGFGDAGAFFWVATTADGVLAIAGSHSFPAAVGRVMIVVVGAYMWYLQLLRVTRRSDVRRTRWRLTPKQLLLRLGVLAPEDADLADEPHEWQVRRIARALRWANSTWPWSQLGTRRLAGIAERTTEPVLAAGRRRWAVGHLLQQNARADSQVMAAVLREVQRSTQAHPVDTTQWAPLDNTRWTSVDTANGHRHPRPVDVSTPAAGNGARRRPVDLSTGEVTGQQAKVLRALCAGDQRPTHQDIARKLRVSAKTVQRALRDLRAVFGVDNDDDLRARAGGQRSTGDVDAQPDTAAAAPVDTTPTAPTPAGVDTTAGEGRT